jgi:hypothetical protein
MRNLNLHPRNSLSRISSLSCLLLLLAGCAGSGSGSNGSGGDNGGGGDPGKPPSVNLTGNWQFQSTQTAGPSTFSTLAGFLNQQGTSGTNSNFTTAALQSFGTTSSGCYSSDPLPMSGSVLGTQVQLRSFPVNGQLLNINANANSAGNQISGSWSVSGGCADGAKGTLTGQEYAPVTGSYSGPITGGTPGQSISLSLNQNLSGGSGDGRFLIGGTAAFNGFACFQGGSITPPNGTIIGSAVNLRIDTNDPNATVVLTGTTNPAADTLTFQSIEITGGNCKGTLSGAVLKITNH